MNEQSDYKQLLDDAKSYLQTRYDLLRLELLDKLSAVIAMVLLVLVMILAGFAAFAYLSVMTVNLLSQIIPFAWACAVLAAFFVLLAIVFYLLRDKIFLNPLIGWLSRILFKEQEEPSSDVPQPVDNP